MTESMAANSAQTHNETINSPSNLESEKKPTKRRSKNKNNSELEDLNLSFELQQGLRIVNEMMSDSYHRTNQPFMHTFEDSKSIDINEYYRVIKNPMWLTKIKENFSKYKNITEVVGDLRLMLENCYRYYGPDAAVSKKGIKLEMILEQKLALLSRDLREKTSLQMTSGRDCKELKGVLKLGGGGMSLILHQVRNEKALRSREVRKRQILDKKVEKQGKDQGAIEWEENLLKEPVKTQLKTSWELPQIGHFLYLCQGILNTPEVPQFELERVLLMPQEAGLLARIMTSLLSSPNQRIHLDKKRPMTYQVWTEKLKNKVQGFYKCYLSKNKNGDAVFGHIGVEPLFYEILGENNPLDEKLFHELTFPQRIWVLKSICDYTLHNHQTVRDGIADQPFVDQRDYVLGLDEQGNRYLHFPQFCGQDLRIYRQSKWRAPKIQIPASVIKLEKQRKIRRKLRFKSNLRRTEETREKTERRNSEFQLSQTSRPSRLRQHVKPVIKLNISENTKRTPTKEITDDESDENNSSDDESVGLKSDNFELIVDSVDSLRKLVEPFAKTKEKWTKNRKRFNGTSPRKPKEIELYERLNNLLVELEPWESKLEQATKRIRNKMYKEWVDFHAKRKQTNKNIAQEDEPPDQWSSSEDEQDEEPEENKLEELSSTSSDENEIEAKKSRLEETAEKSQETTKSDEMNTRDEVKLPNVAAKDLLLSHQKQNTATQAKELYEWETRRQTLLNSQKESDETTSKKPNLIDSEQSLVSRRQSTLSIRLPSNYPTLESPSPTETRQNTSTKQILTLAHNSGMPKILADKSGPDAQFMHFHLGSPTSKKLSKPLCLDAPKVLKNPSPSVESPKMTNSCNSALESPKLLLIPAVTANGERIYLKLAVSNNAIPPGSPSCGNKNSIQVLGQPPPLAPIGKGKLGDRSPVQAVKVLSQPPPLAQIGRRLSSGSPGSALKSVSSCISQCGSSKCQLVESPSGQQTLFLVKTSENHSSFQSVTNSSSVSSEVNDSSTKTSKLA